MECNCQSTGFKAEIDKWARNVVALLESASGRQKFLQYLSERELMDGELTVLFWEKVDRVEKMYTQRPQAPKAALETGLENIICFADNHVNFDSRQISRLMQLRKCKTDEEVIMILEEAKQSASLLLHKDHTLFISWIQKREM